MPKKPSDEVSATRAEPKQPLAKAPRGTPRKKPQAAKEAVKTRLPVLAPQRTTVPCLTCALCCTYIAVAIDGPINVKAASEILWHLYHRDVSVYRDGDDEWMVQFETRCRHLNADNTCAIYDTRPHICRDYSEQSCEVNSPDEGITFYAPDAFLAYLAKAHKNIHRTLLRGYVPDATHLGPDTADKVPLVPFETRFRALRNAGHAPGSNAS